MSSDVSKPPEAPYLSTEISDIIIDYLHDDRKSLSACSLVARHWLPASRYHLIPRITVGVGNADDLLALLDAPHSTLTVLVTELAILAPADEDIGLIYTNKLLEFATKFACLNSLMIVGLNLRMLGNLRSLDHFPTLGITRLFLAHCSLESNDQFSALLSLFNGLEQLSCFRSDDNRALPSSTVALPPLLKTLAITECPMQSTKWWATQPLPPSLQAICIDALCTPDEFQDINSLMGRASSLRSLNIVVSEYYTGIEDSQPYLSLSGCPSLQELTITIRCLHEGKLLWFLPVLVASPAPSSGSLRQLKLVIDIQPQGIHDLLNIPWKNLDVIFTDDTRSPDNVVIDLLNSESFQEDFQVVMFDEVAKANADTIIYEGLEETVACGKLEVRYPAESPMPQYMVDILIQEDEMYPT